MKNCTTSRKTFWLLLALLSLQVFAFAGQGTPTTTELPFQPKTELLQDSKGLLFVGIYDNITTGLQKKRSVLNTPFNTYTPQQKILHHQYQQVQLQQIYQKILLFDVPVFFFSLKIPADETAPSLFFS